jgi:ferritin-like protein
MGRKVMNAKEISQAKNPDLPASLAALQRASLRARKIAIQTHTHFVTMIDGKIIRQSADQLLQEASNPAGRKAY